MAATHHQAWLSRWVSDHHPGQPAALYWEYGNANCAIDGELYSQENEENDFDGTPYLLEKLLEVKDFEAPPVISAKEEGVL